MEKRHGLFKILGACVITSALLGPAPARASDVDRLLDLLVKKHVLTEEDAATFREEVKKDHESKADPPAAETSPVVTAQSGTPGRALAAVETPSATPAKKSETPVTGSSPIRLSGWAQARFTSGASGPYAADTLELRKARLAVDGSLSPRVSYRIKIDVGKSPAMLDARLDYNLRPYAVLTFGQFKVPFSQENLDSSTDLAPIERSLVGLSLVPGRDNGSNGRDVGAQLIGGLTRGDGKPLFDYAIAVFNGSGINRRDDNRRKDSAGRLVLHPLEGLSLAGDYYNGAIGVSNISRERAGVEFAYARGLYSLRGEYIWGHDGALRKSGWYGQATYRFQPKWEALARFDSYDPARHAGGDLTNTYLVGVNWYVSRRIKLQANYGLVDDEARPDLTSLVLSQIQFQF